MLHNSVGPLEYGKIGKEKHRAQQGKSRERREKVQEADRVWVEEGAQERGRMLPQAFQLGLVPWDGWRGLLAGLVWIIQWLRLTNKGKSLHGKAGLPLGNSPNICSAQSFPFLKMPKKAGRGEGKHRLSLFQSPFWTEMQYTNFVLIFGSHTLFVCQIGTLGFGAANNLPHLY